MQLIYTNIAVQKAAHPDVPAFPRNIMDWSTNIYGPVFDRVTKNSLQKLQVGCTEAVAQFSLRENDYVFGERKIGGNAQGIEFLFYVS